MVERLLLFVVACAALVVHLGNAIAQPPSLKPTVIYNPTGQSTVIPARIQNVTPADFGRVWNGVLSGGKAAAEVVDDVAAKVGGKDIVLKSARVVTGASIAKAAASMAGKTIQGAAVSAAIAAAWCKYETGSFMCDERQQQQTETAYLCDNSRYPFVAKQAGSTAVEACTKQVSVASAASPRSCSAGNCSWYEWELRNGLQVYQSYCTTNSGCGAAGFVEVTSASSASVQLCPAVIDFENPAYTQKGGPPDADGKCPTGRYQSTTPEAGALRLAPRITSDNAVPVAKDVVSSGVDLEPFANPQSLSGPASVQGTPTTKTTTSPTGQASSTTTQTTYNMQYNTTVNNFSWTTVTNTTNSDGSSTSETQDPQKDLTDCQKDPTLVSCQTPDNPDGPEKPTKDVQVVVTPDGGWGGDGGSCPAPISTTVLGMPVVVDNSLFCQFLGGIRFAVVGAFGIAAALIFMGAFKGN